LEFSGGTGGLVITVESTLPDCTCEIFDVSGRLVWSGDMLPKKGRRLEARWDGEAYERAADGVYFALIRNTGAVVSKAKLVVLHK
jgi:hypothetical protein